MLYEVITVVSQATKLNTNIVDVLGPGYERLPVTLIVNDEVVIIEAVSTVNTKLVSSNVKTEGRDEPSDYKAT
jgi:hypothetical protein